MLSTRHSTRASCSRGLRDAARFLIDHADEAEQVVTLVLQPHAHRPSLGILAVAALQVPDDDEVDRACSVSGTGRLASASAWTKLACAVDLASSFSRWPSQGVSRHCTARRTARPECAWIRMTARLVSTGTGHRRRNSQRRPRCRTCADAQPAGAPAADRVRVLVLLTIGWM
jgi:hypothetical protein